MPNTLGIAKVSVDEIIDALEICGFVRYNNTMRMNMPMSKRMPGRLKRILTETREALHGIYQSRLKEIILFGSHARGEQVQYSDIDLILLLEKVENESSEREKYLPVISDISLKYDTVLSIIPFDFKEFHSRRTPLILNARKEGIRI